MTGEELRIGVACYPSMGGSGIVATELGLALASRGHEIHFVSYAPPVRLKGYIENVRFHQVITDNYPVFHHPPYMLSLATKLVEVAREHRLDLVHAHYAIPHATCAFLAREMLAERALRTVTTLHGTDITLVGVQPSFQSAVRFSIERSDGVTAVSDWLRERTLAAFEVSRPIEVIPNFVDTARFAPRKPQEGRGFFRCPGTKIVMHASNFRPVKNIPGVIRTFAGIVSRIPASLVLIGEGPGLTAAHEMVRSMGLSGSVFFLGMQDAMDELLPEADLLLLPSEHESFGLIALEAMACGVPVIATDRGGTSELIDSGVTGLLADPFDERSMIEWGVRVLSDAALWERVSRAARERAKERFDQDRIVDAYAAFYRKVLSGG
ncbi:MAG: N-acetyl-alpha-D-glucosaminyl L-malate synthase BshA [Candidatus Eisenbacteria bacterium]|nr:N-acetyl-alpha-D-glucosaminyl L-malate synthase BshA [Candidatus Eisenbacteria bacterium]